MSEREAPQFPQKRLLSRFSAAHTGQCTAPTPFSSVGKATPQPRGPMTMQGPSALPNYGFRAGCPQQPAKVLGVAGDDYVAVVGQERDVRVDNVARSGGATKLADTSGYLSIETVLKDTGKQAGQERLPWPTTSPHLGDTPR